MNPIPTPVKLTMAASGGPAPVALLEVLTIGNALYGWSDATVNAPSILYNDSEALEPEIRGPVADKYHGNSLSFVPWIIKAPVITQYKSTQTSTFTVSIQNLTGDTIRRDASRIFSQQEFYGALIYLRLWRMDCAYSLLDFQGNVTKVSLKADGDSMDLAGEGSFNWAKVTAPAAQIGSTCGNSFNDIGAFSECGAFPGATVCSNSYGTCQQITRFKGLITEWVGNVINYTQFAQPIPIRPYNPTGKV